LIQWCDQFTSHAHKESIAMAKSRTKKKASRGTGTKARSGSAKSTKAAPRGGKRAASAAKGGRSKVKASKKATSKKTAKKKTSAKKTTTARKTAARKPVRKAAKRPATRTKATAVVAQPASASGVVARNPLTHRGTRPSRTQLLLEHQGAPVETVSMNTASGSGPDVRDSNLGELVRSTEVRNLSLKVQSASSRGKRVDNLLSNSASTRIGGHASGAVRRTQGRRDAAQRGEKRPDMGRHAE
jgi:hypothetical protein